MNLWVGGFALGCSGFAWLHPAGREVVVLQWPTQLACKPPKWGKPLADWMPMFRLGLTTLPEAATVGLALSQPALMGLPADAAAKLQPLVAHRYELIAADPVFAAVPGALPYCFSAETPAFGMATLYVPDRVSSKSRSIVFLHGYGGSFLWYLHYLAEVFPDDLILAPAYGVSAGLIPAEYVMESIRAMEKRLGFASQKPRLIGLSAGGFGASRVFADRPEAFSALALTAAYPPADAILNTARATICSQAAARCS